MTSEKVAGPAPAPTSAITLSSATGRWIVLACVLGSGIAGIDSTVVNIALPDIGRDLHVGFAALQWTITSYTLTLAALILRAGAPSADWLIAARALQGVGGALLTPASLAIIEATFDDRDRAKAIGTWSGLSGTASAIAPFVGGWILAAGSWRWVFLINPPLALAVGVIAASDHGFAAPSVWIPLGVGVAGLAAFVLAEHQQAHPMLPLSLFRSRQFSAANAVTLLLYAANAGALLLLVIELQTVSGFSPLLAGTSLLPITVIMLLLAARFGARAQRIGPRGPMAIGPMVSALGLVLMTRLSAGSS